MPPKRKSPVTACPRKTRSMASGKRAEDAPAVTAKKDVEAAEHKGRKKAKKEDVAAAVEEEDGGAVIQDGKHVIVEACTQCQQFKKRTLKVKEDLESVVPGFLLKSTLKSHVGGASRYVRKVV